MMRRKGRSLATMGIPGNVRNGQGSRRGWRPSACGGLALAWTVAVLVELGATAAIAGDSPAAMLRAELAASKISLGQALETAQKQVPDAKVLEAALAWHRTPPAFGVSLLAGEKVRTVQVDLSGAVVRTEDDRLDVEQARELAELKPALAKAKLSAREALEAAAKALGGKAPGGGTPVSVEFDAEGGAARFVVAFFEGQKLIKVDIDALTGQAGRQTAEALPLALWTFDTDAVGQMPAGMAAKETNPGPQRGEWKVTADPTAPSTPNVLALTTSESGGTFNLAIFEKTAFKDLDIRVRVKANSGKEDQGGGVLWRCRDENNYYVCRINPLENNFRVYKVVDGKRTQLQSAEFAPKTGQWYQVRAVMVGDAIQCYVDGKKYLDVKDETFKEAGKIGLWTKADASSAFDNLVVYER